MSTKAIQTQVETSDQWKIAVYEYKNNPTKKYPVLLLHGLTSDHHIWDFGIDQYSFALHLVEKGFHVFSLDLRGRSGSDGPHTGRGKNWSMDDFLLCDLPRVVEYIIEKTGKEKIHWIGHSLGGILGYFYQIRHKAANLQSLTTFASALTYTFSTVNLFRVYLDYISIIQNYPIGSWWKNSIPLIDFDLPWNRFMWHPDNVTPEVKRAVIEKAVHRLGVFEWNQIKMVSTREGMPRITGDLNYDVLDRRIRAPVLMLAGDKDWLCPLDGIEWTQKNIRVEYKLMTFGKDYGNKSHYGHADIVCGIHAVTEVWPHVIAWLNEKDL